MDNRVIDVTSKGKEGIELAVGLIWPNAIGDKATHYRIVKLSARVNYYAPTVQDGPPSHRIDLVEDKTGMPTLILMWTGEKNSETIKDLPFPMNMNHAIRFVQEWLEEVDYGREPDHDGHNERGWRIFTEAWGHVAGHHYAILAVQPAWAMYGK